MLEERFPNVDWICSGCGESLLGQRGFNDRLPVWKCTECGCINKISKDSIHHLRGGGAPVIVAVPVDGSAQILSNVQGLSFIGSVGYIFTNISTYLNESVIKFKLIPDFNFGSLLSSVGTLMHLSVYVFILLTIISIVLKKFTSIYGDNQDKKMITILLDEAADWIGSLFAFLDIVIHLLNIPSKIKRRRYRRTKIREFFTQIKEIAIVDVIKVIALLLVMYYIGVEVFHFDWPQFPFETLFFKK